METPGVCPPSEKVKACACDHTLRYRCTSSSADLHFIFSIMALNRRLRSAAVSLLFPWIDHKQRERGEGKWCGRARLEARGGCEASREESSLCLLNVGYSSELGVHPQSSEWAAGAAAGYILRLVGGRDGVCVRARARATVMWRHPSPCDSSVPRHSE